MQERVVSPKKQAEDIDNTLRPRRLVDYIGQEAVKGNLEISIIAARQRGEALDHVLLYGPPGLGKTTLANIVATELGVRIKTTSGPAIERPGDMVATLTQLKEHEVLFIDEIHRLARVVEEVLYPAMEDFFVSWVIDKGLKARSMNLAIKPFTLIGATTRYGMISAPMRDRFGAVHRLEFYDEDAMRTIVQRSARILEISAEEEGLYEIAKRARGTPRIANRLLRQVRDFAQVMADNTITLEVAQEALARLEVDEIGLDKLDHQVLDSIIGKFDGGPVGLNTLAASINEETETIEDVYEPYLLQRGFLERTSRGRMATRLAYEHLGVEYPRERSGLNQGSLF
ncbi:MAG: Holliday junction branch migration DNA helicase RuvB [Dehalococcoidia bacterium]|nr:Holliday junction branch migration DNA helicase RuvB [Chloroflexota bacterium]MYB49754.1 Holliday junction branch migration DNA helicase RuvB [Dehalococcoidia bacterium]